MQKIWKRINEKSIFITILLINIFLVLTVRFYPSMDGPSHLYNSNLILHLFNGNDILNNYFVLNKMLIPNWISYVILSLFNSFLPAWCAEKILIIAYLIGLSFSFRALIKQLSPENVGLSIIIMPFLYSFIFHLGFYNFSISFIFLFFTLYYWLKNRTVHSIIKHLVLSILIILTYFSAILTFFFLGLILGIFIVAFSINDYFKGKEFSQIARKTIIDLFILLLISLPALILTLIFIKSTTYFPSQQHYSIEELFKWLNDVRCIIVYNYAYEKNFTEQFLHILIAIISISLFIRFYKKGSILSFDKLRKSDIMLLPLILTLLLLFIIPDGSSAGMMSDRYCLIFYMLFIVWGVSQTLPKKLIAFIIALIIILHLGLLFKQYNGSIKGLNKDAVQIYNSSKYIDKNSIVLPVNMSECWIEPHFSNYLGVDKPMIILENYEASVGWFPVRWNTEQLPHIKLGELDKINGLIWSSNTNSTIIKQIDYVYLFGNTDKINDINRAELKSTLNRYYKLVFISENKYIAIYKKV